MSIKPSEHKVTKADVVWFRLFPITFGDKVRIIKEGWENVEGVVIGMKVPMSHSNPERIEEEFFEKTTYRILFASPPEYYPRRENYEMDFKRWELEKV